MADAKPPPAFNFEAPNLKNEWTEWLQNFELYILAAKRKSDSQDVKIAILLNQLGPRGVEIYNTFVADKKSTPKENGKQPEATEVLQKYSEVVAEFTNYFSPKKNILHERCKFNKLNLAPGQSLIEYATALKTAAATCEYVDRNDMVRDRLVSQVPDENLLHRLLDEGEKLTLERAIELCQLHENRKVEIKDFAETERDTSPKVDAVRKKGQIKSNRENRNKNSQKYHCKKCNSEHGYGNCPAYNEICARCKEPNHFAICCPTRNKFKKPGKNSYSTNSFESKRNLHAIDTDESVDETYIDGLKIDNLNSDDRNWHIIGRINEFNVKFKIDSGSHVNVLPLRVYNTLKNSNLTLQESKLKLSAYNGSRLRIEGEIILKTKFKHVNENIKYVVINTSDKPILGLQTCNDLKIIKKLQALSYEEVPVHFKSKEEVLNEYKDVFSGIGKFPGKPYKIHLKADAIPVTYPPRRVPKRLQERLKNTLDRLEKANIISKSEGPTEWQHPLVIVEKTDTNLRLCLDPKHLNEQIMDDKFQIPKIEEMCDDLANKKYYSIVDLRESFYQIPICTESAKLCTFGTCFGSYKFERLPFGIKIASEVFQKKNVDVFGSIKGVKIYIDDIIVAGSTRKEHDTILKKVLEKARECNITFNPEKLKFCQTEIKILGQMISQEGISIDPNRIQAIKEMPEPEDRDALLRFLGVIKYVGNFIPKLSEHTAPLRELTKDGEPWVWTEIHSQCVKKLKHYIVNSPVLAHFKDDEPLIIQCDASSNGIGCVLLQNDRPIAFASRSIRKNETNWAIIEKEMRSVLFAMEKFHYFVYGKEVTVKSDHKPLINIMKKKLEDVPKRLQNMRLKLLKYTFKIEYLPGKDMFLADALSRAYLQEHGQTESDMDYVVHAIIKNTMSENRHQKLVEATKHDPHLSQVITFIKSSWPNNLSGEVGRYSLLKDNLSVQAGLIFFGDRVLIPISQRKEIISRLHEGHLGIEKTRSKARKSFFWPGMSKEIGEFISSCRICLEGRMKNAKEPMIPSDIPLRPWAKIGMDILEHQGRSYLVAMDYYSKWIEFDRINKKSAHDVILWCQKVFANYGFPSTIVSDNNPFASHKFKSYLEQNDVELITSSPHHSQGHAMAETGVRIIENILRKCTKTTQNPFVLLMQYRNTEIPSLGASPSQLMLGRSLRDYSHFKEQDLTINPVKKTFIADKINSSQLQQKMYYDRNAKTLPPPHINDRVLFRHNNDWKHGVVINKSSTPRSWLIQGEHGIIRRNRRDFIINNKTNNNSSNYLGTPQQYHSGTQHSPKKRYSLRDRNNLPPIQRYGLENPDQ